MNSDILLAAVRIFHHFSCNNYAGIWIISILLSIFKDIRLALVAPLLKICNAFLIRCPRAPIVVQQGTSDVSQDIPVSNFGNIIESDHDSAPSPPNMSTEISMTDSRALVAVPEMNVEALAVVPMRKSKRLDVGQRRIRRPFSVSEVEALVQAVEKLGTGRYGGETKHWIYTRLYFVSFQPKTIYHQ